jgi:hypothetical protein
MIRRSADGARVRLEDGEIALEIDAAHGARIVEYSLAGRNLLSGADVHPDNYGSTFWTSPQRDWGWPPPLHIDRLPYQVTEKDAGFELIGTRCPVLGVCVSKRFQLDTAGVVRIEYDIGNQTDRALRMAPWEVTRVARRGVSFFPLGERAWSSDEFAALATIPAHGLHWIEHERDAAGEAKLFADSAQGWLAHAVDGLLFVKSFERVLASEQAAGEGAIELYVSERPRYLELEQQGRCLEIAPRAVHTWRVNWLLSRVPPAIDASGINAPLARLAASVHERSMRALTVPRAVQS